MNVVCYAMLCQVVTLIKASAILTSVPVPAWQRVAGSLELLLGWYFAELHVYK